MRLHSLDSMRGIAALLVVIYHYQHLAAFGQDPFSWTVAVATLPFYAILRPVYVHGWMAVDLFFVISGFVFFWLYRQKIYERKIGAWSFFVKRFMRLYPLHILTLALVMILQGAYAAAMGMDFVVPYNDSFHFVLNLLFIQSWGFERGPSFNAPNWSVSVEILLYLVFFLYALGRVSRSVLGVLCAVGLGLLVQTVSPVLGRGIAGFFAGGLAFHAFAVVRGRPDAVAIVRGGIAVTVLLWGAVLLVSYHDGLGRWFGDLGPSGHANLTEKFGGRFVMYGLFPLTTFSLAASEGVLGWRWTLTSLLGDISYASYLMHFPLQLALAALVAWGWLPRASIHGAVGLAAFFAILIPLSWLTYRYVERPIQDFGRRRLLKPGSAPATHDPAVPGRTNRPPSASPLGHAGPADLCPDRTP